MTILTVELIIAETAITAPETIVATMKEQGLHQTKVLAERQQEAEVQAVVHQEAVHLEEDNYEKEKYNFWSPNRTFDREFYIQSKPK
jgi:hypothetical protein